MYIPKIQVSTTAISCDIYNPRFISEPPLEAKNGAALQDHIYLDAMGFGMGCCCLQLTFQACNVSEARRVYDAFVPVGPIMVKHCSAFRSYTWLFFILIKINSWP